MTCKDRIRELVSITTPLYTLSRAQKYEWTLSLSFFLFSRHTDFFFLAGCRTVKEEVIPWRGSEEEAEGVGGDGEGC